MVNIINLSTTDIAKGFSGVDTLWILIGAALVLFMQTGFAFIETGFTRSKNAGNTIMKNLVDLSFGAIIFWVIGFGIMFGQGGGHSLFNGNNFIGGFDFFINGDYSVAGSIPSWAFVIFQTVFCATAATIVSGAIAERTKFKAYIAITIIICAIIYPISGHWIWGGGWLSKLGFHDFAGSTAIHLVGGVAALIGAKIVGPRLGKYDKKGKSKAIPGHSITLGGLGALLLWFCWFGFNGGSTASMSGDSISLAAKIFVTTNISAAAATIVALAITWIRYKKPDVSMTINGSLAGLVAITAGCDAVNPAGAAIIGIISGTVVVFGIEFVDKILKIDDPVGAIGVHGLCGATGTIVTALFAEKSFLSNLGKTRFEFFGVQLLGVVSVIAWVAITMTIVFIVIKKTIGLRVSKREEIVGLDIEEHGLVSTYSEYVPNLDTTLTDSEDDYIAPVKAVPVEKAVEVETYAKPTIGDDTKLTKIVILAKQSKFEVLKEAMNSIGITGMTVTNVLGCGMQKGSTEFYRGVELEVNLLPKIKVEIVVCKVPVRTVIDTAKAVLYTGHIGDGKIFIYDVENVIKVRTGEEGYDALQDE